MMMSALFHFSWQQVAGCGGGTVRLVHAAPVFSHAMRALARDTVRGEPARKGAGGASVEAPWAGQLGLEKA